MTKRLLMLCLALAAIFGVGRARTETYAEVPAPLDLTTLFDVSTGAVRDTNGDGLPDTIATRVIVPATPTSEDVEGAATIAGRLGHETSAMTLPVVVRDSELSQPGGITLPILIGRENQFIKRLVASGAL